MPSDHIANQVVGDSGTGMRRGRRAREGEQTDADGRAPQPNSKQPSSTKAVFRLVLIAER